jgi:hypothetical protein
MGPASAVIEPQNNRKRPAFILVISLQRSRRVWLFRRAPPPLRLVAGLLQKKLPVGPPRPGPAPICLYQKGAGVVGSCFAFSVPCKTWASVGGFLGPHRQNRPMRVSNRLMRVQLGHPLLKEQAPPPRAGRRAGGRGGPPNPREVRGRHLPPGPGFDARPPKGRRKEEEKEEEEEGTLLQVAGGG